MKEKLNSMHVHTYTGKPLKTVEIEFEGYAITLRAGVEIALAVVVDPRPEAHEKGAMSWEK